MLKFQLIVPSFSSLYMTTSAKKKDNRVPESAQHFKDYGVQLSEARDTRKLTAILYLTSQFKSLIFGSLSPEQSFTHGPVTTYQSWSSCKLNILAEHIPSLCQDILIWNKHFAEMWNEADPLKATSHVFWFITFWYNICRRVDTVIVDQCDGFSIGWKGNWKVLGACCVPRTVLDTWHFMFLYK